MRTNHNGRGGILATSITRMVVWAQYRILLLFLILGVGEYKYVRGDKEEPGEDDECREGERKKKGKSRNDTVKWLN